MEFSILKIEQFGVAGWGTHHLLRNLAMNTITLTLTLIFES